MAVIPITSIGDRVADLALRGDLRIHFSLVCGAQAFPPIHYHLSREIDQQLDLAASVFINSGG